MSDLPLHPLVVHFPLVLAVLAPIAVLLLTVALLRGRPAVGLAWLSAFVLGGLAVSAYVAIETGEQDEERVMAITGEDPLERHEEAAELLLVLSLVGAGLAVASGLVSASDGAVRARLPLALATLAAAGAVAYAAVRAGHSGGELVYVHGAALAHLRPGALETGVPAPGEADRGLDHEGQDED
jgi:hypothetical protein